MTEWFCRCCGRIRKGRACNDPEVPCRMCMGPCDYSYRDPENCRPGMGAQPVEVEPPAQDDMF